MASRRIKIRRVSAYVDQSDLPEEEWWKTNVDKVSVLIKLCSRAYDWDDATAKKVLKSYRQFLVIKREHSDWDSKKFTPCWSVDQMWKQHSTLDDYDFDMSNLCELPVFTSVVILLKRLQSFLPF
jgi:hypothetical protein